MIYCSLKENTYYDSELNVFDYKLVDGKNNVIYFGHSVKNPKTGLNRINITEIVRDYLSSNLEDDWPELSNEEGYVYKQENAFRMFSLINGEIIVQTYGFLYDFKDLVNTRDLILSDPIDGKCDPRMKIFWTAFSKDGIDFKDYENMYLTIRALEDNVNVWLCNHELHYVTDPNDDPNPTHFIGTRKNGGSWQMYKSYDYEHPSGTKIELSSGDTLECFHYGDLNSTGSGVGEKYANFNFHIYGKCEAYGNVLSMKYGTEFRGEKESIICRYLFGNDLSHNDLVNAKNVVIPSTALTSYCYQGMFEHCHILTEAPLLPLAELAKGCYRNMFIGCSNLEHIRFTLEQTNLEQECYAGMFYGCTSLKEAPALPATTLAHRCYQSMFGGCTSLKTAPALPATALTYECYGSMFTDCSGLTIAPSLPATDLTEGCYGSMFAGCKSLTTAPALPSTTLASRCYSHMFGNCTNLVNAPSLPATNLPEYCYFGMFNNCTSLTATPIISVAEYLDRYCYQEMFKGCTGLITAQSITIEGTPERCCVEMFSGCTSLTTPPVLSSLFMSKECYAYMFAGCTSLTTAPSLPASTLEKYCYQGMFSGCTSLTTPPVLGAMALDNHCYDGMFGGCTSLTTAPDLLALGYKDGCYNGMFRGCTNLSYIKCLLLEPGNSATAGWVNGVTEYDSSRIFVRKTGVSWLSGINGIPYGWSIQEVNA